MDWITPPECQGQIVVYSYRLVGDFVYQRVEDQSDRTTEYYVSKAIASDAGDYQNGAPKNKRWRKATEEKANAED